ncbi:MAG TPA: hypothetical protein VM325_10005 [Alphaproteobacteria bacterium]|nr:hypothetical protein [Alphaproteobacteria bacterium]
MAEMTPIAAVLGDSRAFDTYFVNADYAQRYGYDKTFPHLWRKRVLSDPAAGYDVVHIPDHFRGGTVQNNIVRLALTDPSVVVVLDGIWETLLNKRHILDFAERRIRAHDAAGSDALTLTYGPLSLAELFKAGELSVSPQNFAERTRALISYFRRRQRQVIVMTLPVPPKSYVGSTYHAGDYRPPPGWDECLAAMNAATLPVIESYGAHILDLTVLMDDLGGPRQALIDQWHFSPAFHARLAEALDDQVRALLPDAPGPDHVSHKFMLGPATGAVPPEVIVHAGGAGDELAALAALGPGQILVYPGELSGIDNPRGNDRAEFEKQTPR